VDARADQTTKGILVAVFLTAFLDLVGFSIIFPLFPAMLDHYVALEGADSLVGRLAAALTGLAAEAGDARFLVVVLFGGVLGSLYSVLQFLFAPIWGSVSDRIGRRPTLLLTLTGTMLSYLAWFFAGRFWLLIVARLLGGIMAGNISTATAVIADATPPEQRSRGMAIIGVAFGLGFVVGPALGGVCSLFDLSAAWPGGVALGVNPFSAPALLALGLSIFNLGLVARRLPETHPPERRGRAGTHRTANPLRLFRGLDVPGFSRANLVSFLYLTAFSAMEFTLVFLAVERFGYTPRDNAKMFVFVGVVVALVQGGFVRRLAPRLGDKPLVVGGLAAIAPGFVLVGMSGSTTVLFAGLGLMAAGSAFATPCLGALASRYAPDDQQGFAMGVFRSMGALSRAVGPLLGGVLYWRHGAQSPYLVGAVLLLVPFALALALPPPPTPEQATGP
jgi:MFS family permease